MAGSGMRAKPSATTEVSREGLSLKTKRTPSRAPAACSSAESMARAVWENSRSAVSSGPRSDSASTVRRSRRKFVFLHATVVWGKQPEQRRVPRGILSNSLDG